MNKELFLNSIYDRKDLTKAKKVFIWLPVLIMFNHP